MIFIEADYSDLYREFDRLDRMPSFEAKAELETVLLASYALAQATVHRDTTSLAQSETQSSKTSRGVWKGEISFGGISSGPNPDVNYAIYEKARGGDHDFFHNQHLMNEPYLAAMKAALS